MLPERSRLSRPRKVELRAVVNAILYILETGCQWRALPRGVLPLSTVELFLSLARSKTVCPLSRIGSPYTAPSRVARSGRADPLGRRASRGAAYRSLRRD
ncbi:transposase [Ancylobacter polymorphus]|uniref:transposase n=1 Tax=Ancylobacter polymorphus TaxID=223390 RepID=UPI003D768720